MKANIHRERDHERTVIKNGIRVGLMIVFFLNLVFLYPASVSYAQSTTITLSPDPAAIQGCEELEVDIMINDVTDLWAADVRLSFDPGVLEVVDQDAGKTGVQIADGPLLNPSWYGFQEHADNTAGTIQYAVTQFNPDLPVSGSGVLATITFRAKSAGSSALTYTYTKLSDREGNELPADTTDGSVSTTAPASPDVGIAKANATDLTLSWPGISGAAEYDIFRGTSPYFTPSALPLDTIPGSSYTDAGVMGDASTNYYYVVKSVCDSGFSSQNSNRVGEYDYALSSASAANYNDIAMALSVPGVNDAESLANYAGSSVNYVLKYQASSQSFQIYSVGNPGSNYSLSVGDYVFLITDSTTPSTLALAGDVPAPGSVQFSLVTGTASMYNFVSLPLDRGDLQDASDVAADIGSGVSRVMKYNSGTQLFEIYSPGNPASDFPMRIGEPFMLFLTSAAPGQWP